MPISMPGGIAPFEIVPRFTIVGAKQPKAKWHTFLDENRAEIRAMLTTPLMDDELDQLFRQDLDYFFVDKKFENLRGSINPAKTALERFVDAFSKPARQEIEAISTPRLPLATSLSRILKLAKLFEVAISQGNHEAITYFQLESGNPFGGAACVVPSIYGVAPSTLRTARMNVGGDDQGYKAFLRSRNRSSSAANIFEASLEDGSKVVRGSSFHYLVTYATAKSIFEYFQHCAATHTPKNGGLQFGSVEEMFTVDMRSMTVVGRCSALPVSLGNLLEFGERKLILE